MAHKTTLRVRFYELDPYDHVNHTNYLNYFETARIEALSEMGWGMDVMKQQGLQMVVVGLSARFHAPAEFHDQLTITTRIGKMRRAQATWVQEMHRGDQLVASLEVLGAFTRVDGRPRRAPDGFADQVAEFLA